MINNQLVALIEQANSEVSGKKLTDAEAIAAKASVRLSKEQFLASIEAVERVFIKEYERILKIAGNESQAMKVFSNLKQKKNFYDCFGIARDTLNLATWFRNQSRKVKRILLSKIHLLSKTNLKRIIKLSSEDTLDFLKKVKTKTLEGLNGTLGEKATKHKRIEYLLDDYQNTHIFLEDLVQEKHWDLAKSRLETKHKKIARDFNWDEVKEKVAELSAQPNGENLLQILMEIDDPALPEKYFKSLFRKRIKEGSSKKKSSKESAEIDRLNGELEERDERIRQLGIDSQALENKYNTLDEQAKEQAIEHQKIIAQMEKNHADRVTKLIAQMEKNHNNQVAKLEKDNEELRSRIDLLEAKINEIALASQQSPLRAESAANNNKRLDIDYKVKVIERTSKQFDEIGDIVGGDCVNGWRVSFPMPEELAGPAIQISFPENQLAKVGKPELVGLSGSKEADPSRGTGFGSLIKNSNNNTARSA